MTTNDRTYRQLHPRVIDARPRSERMRRVCVIGLAVAFSALWWLLVLGFILGVNTGMH